LENKQQVQLEKEKDEIERENIKNKMRMDKVEVEQRRKIEREKNSTKSTSSGSFSKKKAVVGEDGKLEWVEDTYLVPENEEGGFLTLEKMKKESKPKKTMGTLSQTSKDENEDEEQGEMDINELVALVVKLLTQEGYPRTIEWLLRRGFSAQDAAKLCEIATHVMAHHTMEKDQQMMSPKKEHMINRGHRLGGNDESKDEIEKNLTFYDNDELDDLYNDNIYNSLSLSNSNDTKIENNTTTNNQDNTTPPPPVEEKIEYKTITVDPNIRVTKIRVILLGGGQDTIPVNLTNTVKELMEHIANISSMPVNKFKISFAYPKTVISNIEQTIDEAKLVNAKIIQEKI